MAAPSGDELSMKSWAKPDEGETESIVVETETKIPLGPPREDEHEKATHIKAASLARSITSRSIATSWRDPGPPPDGGRQAWTQAAMLHLTIFSTFGYTTSFGSFQTYYEGTLGLSPSTISWLGSVQIFLLFFIGTFSGRALDAGLFRSVYITGSVLQILGTFRYILNAH